MIPTKSLPCRKIKDLVKNEIFHGFGHQYEKKHIFFFKNSRKKIFSAFFPKFQLVINFYLLVVESLLTYQKCSL